jgi:hypothetical protein
MSTQKRTQPEKEESDEAQIKVFIRIRPMRN